MKKIILFLGMLLSLGIKVNTNSETCIDNIDVYVSKDTVHPKTTIECYYSTELSPNYTSWLFFIDDVPFGNWSHLCRYVYVNAIGGKYEIHENTWLPTSLGSEFIPLVQTPPEPWDESKYSIPVY